MKRLPPLLLLLLLAAVAIPVLGQSGTSGPAAGAAPVPVGDLPVTLAGALDFGALKAAAYPGVDPELLALAASASGARLSAAAAGYDLPFADGRVQTAVTYHDLAAAEKAISEAGGEVTVRSAFEPVLQAWLPPGTLASLAAGPAISAIGRPLLAEPVDIDAGSVDTQGIGPLNALAWHNAGQKGAGVKVAIVDVGFIGYTALLGTDLPASVTVRNFVDGQSAGQVGTGNVHGTGVAEIVHDVAPEAQLFLFKISSNLDLEQAVDEAINLGVDIITTSLIWYNATPGDGTGIFANIVQEAYDNGILWTTASGNDRQRHWGGTFSDGDGDDVHNFIGDQEVNFFYYYLSAGDSIRLYLRWNDWQQVDQDLDLYIVRYDESAGTWSIVTNVIGGTNTQNGGAGQRPVEAVSYTATGADAAYGFIIHGANLTHSVDFDILGARTEVFDQQVTLRSMGNLADAPKAITAGAVSWSSPYGQFSYSAEGPTNGSGGSAGSSGAFDKPEITAYASVSTVTYPSFGGTSAAAPHVAGAAAILAGAFPSYTPAQLRSYLVDNAKDLGSSGFDPVFGFGRASLADPVPTGIVETAEPTSTPTATVTSTATQTATATPTATVTGTATQTATAAATATPTGTAAATQTATATATTGPSPTATATATTGPSPTATATAVAPSGFTLYLPAISGYPGPD